MIFQLSFILATLSIFTSIMVIISLNPVHSIFFLILSFIFVCGNIFLLEIEFLPLIFIVIYVGAISILFLFIVMMLDIKFVIKKQNKFSVFFLCLFIFLSCFFFFLCFKDILFFQFSFNNTNFNWFNFIDKNIDINSIGQYLYLDFVIHFLIVVLILLVAIIGAVTLTVKLNKPEKNKSQHLFKQIARTNTETFYLVK